MKKQARSHKPIKQSSPDISQFDIEDFSDAGYEEKKSMNPIAIGASILVIIGLIVVGFMKRNSDHITALKTKTIPDIVAKLDAGVKVKEVRDLKEVSGMYQFELQLEVNGQVQKFTSYMTKDGKYFFTGGIQISDLDKNKTDATDSGEPKKMTCEDITKTDTTSVTAFVVADCPYGLQMQRVMKTAIGEESQLGNYMNVRYIGSVENGKITSMHGEKEAQENLRQICIREEQKALYWPYVSCYMKAGKTEECLKDVGVNTTMLNSCTSDASKGLSYASKDFAIADEKGISSSPTLLVNDETVSEFDFGGRTSDALKSIVCCSSKNKPGFCAKELSKTSAAVAFSSTDTAEEGSVAGANCN